MKTIALAYITVSSQKSAQALAQHLLEKQLIACANIIPIESIYTWQGALEQQTEHLLIAKTLPELFDNLKEAVLSVHPYETPCILQIASQANESYYNFIAQFLQST